jgi:probable phosphomutase (TIGR03848 family)
VPTVLLVRHGRTAANASGVLAGWTPGVGLDETGRAQASALATRLAPLPIALAVSSPLQRCQQTASALLAVPFENPPTGRARGGSAKSLPRPGLLSDDRLGECRYGDWTGRALKDLAKDPLWRVVQAHPSAVTFPGEGGESMLAMQARAVDAIRHYDATVAAEHGDDAIWLAVSHGDVIKAILADALGMHLDAFQRLIVDPCSVSVIRFTPLRPFAVRINDSGAELAALAPVPSKKRRRASSSTSSSSTSSDAVVGGATGAANGASAAGPAAAAATGSTTPAAARSAVRATARSAADAGTT